jgi:hypothetical protein
MDTPPTFAVASLPSRTVRASTQRLNRPGTDDHGVDRNDPRRIDDFTRRVDMGACEYLPAGSYDDGLLTEQQPKRREQDMTKKQAKHRGERNRA